MVAAFKKKNGLSVSDEKRRNAIWLECTCIVLQRSREGVPMAYQYKLPGNHRDVFFFQEGPFPGNEPLRLTHW